jgi:hypothetical protein
MNEALMSFKLVREGVLMIINLRAKSVRNVVKATL